MSGAARSVDVDAAMGRVMDQIGEAICRHRAEDSSGLRRALLDALIGPSRALCKRLVPGITDGEIDSLREAAVSEFGDPVRG